MNERVIPNITKVSQEVATVKLGFNADADLIVFDGHFPNMPILPGVAQIHWAIHFARQYFAGLSEHVNLQQIKFNRLIRPDQYLDLVLTYHEHKSSVAFQFFEQGEVCSSGQLVFVGLD